MKKDRILITSPKGLPPYLKEELLSLGFPIIAEYVAGIETEGSLDDTMKLNLFLRTGHRVLYHLKDFHAVNADQMYKEIRDVRWEDYLHEDGYMSVTSSVDNPTIKDSRFANQKCKDAIVDRFYAQFGRRPDSGPDQSKAVVYLYWKGNDCSLYLDTSGEPLSKRGYRKISYKAPMQETLAAALIMATGWNGNSNFINPMCGSGTLAIEAALIGLNRPPGILRDNFGFMYLKGFNKILWEKLRKDAKTSAKKLLKYKVVATDINSDAIEAAKKNADTAGVRHLIEFNICDFRETQVPTEKGIIMLNPEYGERMGQKEELEKVYDEIGDFFKQRCMGYMGYIFTGNFDLAKKVGLRTKRRIPFFNGNIECRLLEYELYEGSRKSKSAL
ncbi:MAG: class I SAM-dependent RNA methyltransferase [Nitrospirae bacterium]|nr:class I SAM-dependent RNA methyltransferase [Nitrospirota bacterium]